MTIPVAPAGQTTWCTVADVVTFTGKTVSAEVLAMASATLELHVGRTYFELMSSPDGHEVKIGRRDLEWLRRACAYQAAWQTGQPDLFTRLDADAIGTGGRPIQLKDRGLTLAPLARKAVQRVSWLRTRSLHVRTPFQDGLGPISGNATSAANDAYESWSPMGFGIGDD